MRKYEFDYLFDEKEQKTACWQPDSETNKYITETAGFVPLDVKFARFEQAGLQAQFSVNEFTSADYRDMYLSPDFEITPEDDFEEVQEKLQLRQQFIEQLKKSKTQSVGSEEKTVKEKAGTEEPTTKEKTEETAAAE